MVRVRLPMATTVFWGMLSRISMEQMREGKHLNQQHIDGLRLHYNDLNLASLGMGMASWSYLDGAVVYSHQSASANTTFASSVVMTKITILHSVLRLSRPRLLSTRMQLC